jgi:hypothetical protein
MNHDENGDKLPVEMKLKDADREVDAMLLPGGVVNADKRMDEDARKFVKAMDSSKNQSR